MKKMEDRKLDFEIEGGVLNKYNGTEEYVVIPESVTSIGAFAFANCESIVNVVIPENVKSIENGAFFYCNNLKEVTISNGVTDIDVFAFASCTSLTSINIPESVTGILTSAFNGCAKLNSITVNENNPKYKSIDGNLYTKDGKEFIYYAQGKTETSFAIPEFVNEIGIQAFSCDSLETVIIPKDVTVISDFAFPAMPSLSSIMVDENNPYYKSQDGNLYTKDGSTLKRYAPAKKESSFVISKSVTKIASGAFNMCSNIESITIPSSVTAIGSFAFASCKSLSSITIPSGVTEIDNYAFDCCDNLKVINIEANKVPTTWSRSWNSDNIKLSFLSKESADDTNLSNDIIQNASPTAKINTDSTLNSSPDFEIENGILIKYKGKSEDVVIPDGIHSIHGFALRDCKNLRSITVPAGVTHMGDYSPAIIFNEDLEHIHVDENNVAFKAVDNILYSKDGYKLMRYAPAKPDTSIVIPYGVKSIGDYAFSHCTNAKSLAIPDTLTYFNVNAFLNCNSFAEFSIFPESSNNSPYKSVDGSIYTKDGKKLIRYATGKSDTSFVIPDGVTTICEKAFENCKNLVNITIPDSVETIEDSSFIGCENLESIIIPKRVKIIGYQAFAHCRSLKNVSIPDEITIISDSAFIWCSALEGITIPESVKSIESFAFMGCMSLKNITIPKHVMTIGSSLFFLCSELKAITVNLSKVPLMWNEDWNSDNIPVIFTGKADTAISDVNVDDFDCDFEIEDGVLKSYHGKCEDIIIPDGVKIIGDNAFSHSLVKSVTIPKTVTEIGASAFASSKLRNITLPESVKTIGPHAFNDCYYLGDLSIPYSVTYIGEHAFDNCKRINSINIEFDEIPNAWDRDWNYCNIPVSLIKNGILKKYIGDSSDLNILNGVTVIDECAFYGLKNLREVSISDCINSIGDSAFEECINLENVVIDSGVSYIGDKAFSNCPILTIWVPDNTDIQKWGEKWNCGRPVYEMGSKKLLKKGGFFGSIFG